MPVEQGVKAEPVLLAVVNQGIKHFPPRVKNPFKALAFAEIRNSYVLAYTAVSLVRFVILACYSPWNYLSVYPQDIVWRTSSLGSTGWPRRIRCRRSS